MPKRNQNNAVAITSTAIAAIAAVQHIAEHEMTVISALDVDDGGPIIEGEVVTQDQVGDLSDVLGDNTTTETEESDDDEADESTQVPASDYEGQTLASIADTIVEKDRLKMAKKIAKAFDDRSAYETEKNKTNERIHKELGKSRVKLVMPSAAAILIAAQVDAGFVNNSVSNGSRYNVYAVDKLADLVTILRDGKMKNKVNIAVCKSLFRFRAAGEAFTGEMAKAAVCDKITVSAAMQKLLVRHTVDPGTMSTQTSSTMTALQTLGIVKNTGTFRSPVYELTDTPQTARLQEVMAA